MLLLVRFSICFFLFTTVIHYSNAQNNVYSKNQFEFNLYSGASLVKFEEQEGIHRIENQLTPLYGCRFQYNRRLNKNFQISGSLGLGAHGFTFTLPENNDLNIGSERESYFNSFQEIYVGAKYTHLWKNIFHFGVNLGGGVVNFLASPVQILGEYQNLDNGQSIQLSNIFYQIPPNPIPFLELGPQISRTFKNKNQLSLKLSYFQSFRPIYEGNYQIFDNTSRGRLSNSGSNFRVSLSYTFTGDKRADKISRLNSEMDDLKKARIEYKKQKRYIHPKSMFVSLITGLGAVKSYSEDPNGFLEDSYGHSLVTRLTFEKGIKNNFFGEASYQLLEYYGSLKFKKPPMVASWNSFFTHQLNLGMGYRVIGIRRNYHYLNVHGGISFGFLPFNKGGIVGEGGGYSSNVTTNGFYEFEYEFVTEVSSPLIIAPYVGLSKDFRLSERLFISIMYKYQYGLNNLTEGSITYQNNEEYTSPQNVKSYMTGTEHNAQVGLKIKL